MHQSFVTTAHPPMGKGGGCPGLKCRANYFSSVLSVQGKPQDFDNRILTPGRFSIVKGRAKSKVLTSSLPLGMGLIAEH